jgi:septum site-determining protein MinC
MESCISINTKQGKVIIKIAEDALQEEIMVDLKKKLKELKKLYKDDDTPILVSGKVLKNKEMEQIQNLIKSIIDTKIDFDSPKILGLHGIKKTFNKDIATSETKFHRGSLRSGQRVEFEGSLVILGDVNAGAEVIAGENVVVVGILRGLAHAGAKGNKEAIIAAASIEAPQLRIANIVKERAINANDEYNSDIKTAAYVNDKDEIIIE